MFKQTIFTFSNKRRFRYTYIKKKINIDLNEQCTSAFLCPKIYSYAYADLNFSSYPLSSGSTAKVLEEEFYKITSFY